MSPLSSSTLFHFTASIDSLVGILADEFRPRYSYEDFTSVFGRPRRVRPTGVGIPMVCFCDIPLSQAARHMETYGRYALGLTKDWGVRHGLAPIVYSYDGSGTSSAILDLFERSADAQLAQIPDEPTQEEPISEFSAETDRLLCFMKPYQGMFHRPGQAPKEVRFYDEREWRFVPLGNWSPIDLAAYRDFILRKEANECLHVLPSLPFTPADVRYVIVSDDSEILPMIRSIERIKRRYSADDVRLLCSRVVSADQVQQDF